MTAADLAAVLTIERAAFAVPWSQEVFVEELGRSHARLEVLTQGDRVLAFANYWLVADELHLLKIATHRDHLRQGLGAHLLRHVVEVARREAVRAITLEVRRSNEAALALYRAQGFRSVGVRPRYYTDNDEDAILMDRELV